MRVLCRHGHFSFYPRNASDIASFSNFFNLSLERENDYFTFSKLAGAPKYSLAGKPYLNLPTIKTYAGEPWEVMRENDFVYNFTLGAIVPKISIVSLIDLPLVGYFYLGSGALIQPGSRDLTGQQILSYSGEFVDSGYRLRVTEFDYE